MALSPEKIARRGWVEDMFGIQFSDPEEFLDPGAPPKGIVAYRKALLEFGVARQLVARQIADLVKAIPAVLPDEADLAEAVAEEIEALNDVIGDAIDAAMNAAQNERAPYTAATRKVIEGYLQRLASDPMVKHVDSNPFSPVSVAATLGAALTAIATRIV